MDLLQELKKIDIKIFNLEFEKRRLVIAAIEKNLQSFERQEVLVYDQQPDNLTSETMLYLKETKWGCFYSPLRKDFYITLPIGVIYDLGKLNDGKNVVQKMDQPVKDLIQWGFVKWLQSVSNPT